MPAKPKPAPKRLLIVDDHPMMREGLAQLIANDPASTIHFSTRINGQAFLASDTNSVGTALQEIRSEILRLSH